MSFRARFGERLSSRPVPRYVRLSQAKPTPEGFAQKLTTEAPALPYAPADTITADDLIPPCGGALVDRFIRPELCDEMRDEAGRLPSIRLSERAICDLELLATGAFSPLDRFMSRRDYETALGEMRLANGHLFPVPVTLPVSADELPRGASRVALRDRRNDLLALMDVEEVYETSREELCREVFGTLDPRHPLVAESERWGRFNISGRLDVLRLPRRYDFADLRLTPAETRRRLAALGRRQVAAFQTRNPLHRAHEELTERAARSIDGTLLLHPAVGLTKPGDVDHFTRVRTYKSFARDFYDPDRIVLALLPLAMRMAGPREALWHAVIRRNYGANHLIVGRDHASPGANSTGEPFYGVHDAQALVSRHAAELGVRMIGFEDLVYLPGEDRYEEASRVPSDAPRVSLSGTQVREEYLDRGATLPSWFTRPATAAILRDAYPPRYEQGVCVWFTGLSGAGKSATADVLVVLLMEHGRRVTLLDGDVVRTNLSEGLGFGKEDRDRNVRRIGFVASEVARHGGVSVCAAVSPYRATRDEVRSMFSLDGFIEVHVATPLDVCERRDAKGMYARARRGEIKEFTGISDPYEPPTGAEITLDAVNHTPEENARRVLDLLIRRGFVRAGEPTDG